jgi:hypothetical protein
MSRRARKSAVTWIKWLIKVQNNKRNISAIATVVLMFACIEIGRDRWRNYIRKNGREVTGYVTGSTSNNIYVAYFIKGRKYAVTVPRRRSQLVAGDSCKLKYNPRYFEDIVLMPD